MKLLITTQIVDKSDPNLGFFHRWIEEFAKHCERVEVICLSEGEHTLPKNVHVHSLGKEKMKTGNGFSRLIYAIRFNLLIFKLRRTYDTVFVHMNPEYVVLGGWFWKLYKKKISLWYMHRSVTRTLKIAERVVDAIFTASPESFRLQSKQLHIVGHGIDTEKFAHVTKSVREKDAPLRIVTISRISPSKRIIEMLDVLDVLAAQHISFSFSIAGGAGTPEDDAYVVKLKEEIAKRSYRNRVIYLGPISHDRVPEILAHGDVFLNLSVTGSLDKAVLEPLLLGIPAVTTNEAFKDVLSEYGLYVDEFDPAKVADAIQESARVDTAPLKKYVLRNHSLSVLIPRILKILSDSKV